MWQGLVSMRLRVISESYAREHHARWYFGERKAKELWKVHLEEIAESEKTSRWLAGRWTGVPEGSLVSLVGYG
jgi:hypothetical protein